MRAAALLAAALAWSVTPAGAQDTGEAGPSRASGTPRAHAAPWAPFEVRVDGAPVPLRVMAFPVAPGQRVEIASTEALPLDPGHDSPPLRRSGEGAWLWTAPGDPGFHAVGLRRPGDGQEVHLTFMVLTPFDPASQRRLGGYAIGEYQSRRRSQSAAYEPPRGFVEVSRADEDILISPHFRLGQFLCKQPGDPRYALVSPALLVKLEALLEAVNRSGHSVPTLTIMSGFRTPAYNRAIGNTTVYSRHLWGDAADVYVDADGDGQMDDLDGNGRIDVGDARALGRMMEALVGGSRRRLRSGGLASYRRNAAHGPFLHVDARGTRARW